MICVWLAMPRIGQTCPGDEAAPFPNADVRSNNVFIHPRSVVFKIPVERFRFYLFSSMYRSMVEFCFSDVNAGINACSRGISDYILKSIPTEIILCRYISRLMIDRNRHTYLHCGINTRGRVRSAHVTRHLPLSKYVHTHSGRSKNERGDCDNESEDSIESSVL